VLVVEEMPMVLVQVIDLLSDRHAQKLENLLGFALETPVVLEAYRFIEPPASAFFPGNLSSLNLHNT
jgi:hypothetical protein